jgi:DtxR family Mn-dependent transcriptional regulator
MPEKQPRPSDDAVEMAAGEISPTMREYLAHIYRLTDRQTPGSAAANAAFVSTSALAELLDVSAPAVNRMVTRLRDQGFLVHEPYQGIRLTPAGEREALRYLRRHRIVEAFLVKVMGFGWDEVHQEATAISRALTDVVTARMYTMAGEPTRCPHGEPIPAPDDTLPPHTDVPIPDATPNVPLIITRVTTRERDRLEYIAALGLVPDTRLELLHVAPFSGPIQVKVGKEFRIIGHNLAEMIRVQPA